MFLLLYPMYHQSLFVQNLTISYKGDEISHVSCIVFEIWCRTDRETTDDRRQTWRPKQKALML